MAVIMDWFKSWQQEQPSVAGAVSAAPETTINLSPGTVPQRETGPYSWQFPSTGPPSVTLPKGVQGESVWGSLSEKDREIGAPFPGPGPADTGGILKQVTRVAVIIIVGLIGIMALLQIMPVPSFRR